MTRKALALVLLALGAACKSGDTASDLDSGKIDCRFVADRGNCWRAFVSRVDSCLGQADGGVPLDAGVLASDHRSCTYAERIIVANGGAQNLDDPQPTTTDPNHRDFTLSKAGRACLTFRQVGEAGVALEAEGVAISYESNGNTLTLTCSDGRVLRGNANDLLDCVTAGGGLPGYAYRNDSEHAWFTVLGMNSPVYDCVRAADAGDEGG